jgi:predicted aspartyl protease
MIRATVLALALGVALLAAVPEPARAQIYRWVDERGTAHYVDGLDNVPQRYRSRATSLGMRNAPAAPPAAAPAEKAGPSGATTITFKPGDRILADARINGRAAVRLLLDTGADRTVIAPRALVAAGISLTRGTTAGQIVGVTGATDAQAVVLDSLEVGDARVAKLAVVSHDINQSGIDGLLGRDFLEQFKVTIAPK